MNKILNSNGFSVVHALLILIILGIVGFTGWYVWDANQQATKDLKVQDSSVPATKNSQSTNLSKKYADPVGKFSINYPASWKLTAKSDAKDESMASSEAKLTSPTGTTLSLRSDWGGKGGYCEPDDDDKPFADGNACATNEYLSSEVVPIDNVYYAEDVKRADGTIDFNYRKTKIMLVSSRYADQDGESIYSVGLVDSTPERPVILNKPTMGLVIAGHYFTVYDANGKLYPYIYSAASSTDEKFLTSKDADTVKAILRTLKISL